MGVENSESRVEAPGAQSSREAGMMQDDRGWNDLGPESRELRALHIWEVVSPGLGRSLGQWQDWL